MLTIVPAYAAVLALGYVLLATRVIRMRYNARVSLGAGGNTELERRIRAHGNFAEYVPFALLLLAFVELQGHAPALIHGLCLLLVAGRAAHACGLSTGAHRLRVLGVTATFIVLCSAAATLLSGALPLLRGG
jgi:uncharacterized membrane protein YecN with MAPEG domain